MYWHYFFFVNAHLLVYIKVLRTVLDNNIYSNLYQYANVFKIWYFYHKFRVLQTEVPPFVLDVILKKMEKVSIWQLFDSQFL